MEPIAAEGDTVIARGHQRYTARRTGRTVDGPVLHIFSFGADGLVHRFEEWEADVGDAWGRPGRRGRPPADDRGPRS